MGNAIFNIGEMPKSCGECILKYKKFSRKYYSYDIYEYRCILTKEFLYDNAPDYDDMFVPVLKYTRNPNCELKEIDEDKYNCLIQKER